MVWWSFYEGDASFDNFVARTIRYLSGGKVDPQRASRLDVEETLLQVLYAPGTLLVLDGFERQLRAFGGLDAAYQGNQERPDEKEPENDRDCISPLAEQFLRHITNQPGLRSKVLEDRGGGPLAGCREEPLNELQPTDAVAFFHAQGIRGTHTEIEAACAPYCYHPLSLRLLAGLILTDLRQSGDVAAARRLDVSGDLIQRQHHVLQAAYVESATLLEQLEPKRSLPPSGGG